MIEDPNAPEFIAIMAITTSIKLAFRTMVSILVSNLSRIDKNAKTMERTIILLWVNSSPQIAAMGDLNPLLCS